MTTKTIKTTKRGRKPGSFEKRDYFRKYRSNLHDLLDSPAKQYQLTRIPFITPGALTSCKNAITHGSMPTRGYFTSIAKALWTIDMGKSGMSLERYSIWLADEAPKE